MLQRDVRNQNRRIVFDLFRQYGELTRVDASKRAGISMPSVLKAIQPFVDAGILVPMGEASAPLGRRPLLLRFNPDAIAAYGIEFEGDRLSVGLVRIDGSIEKQVALRVRHSFDDDLVRSILSGLEALGASGTPGSPATPGGRRLAGIGIGIPGAVDPARQRIRFAPLIGVHEPTDAAPILRQVEAATGLPVFMENDANVAAVGEYLLRGEADPDARGDLLFVSLGTGLGGGLILDGALRRGAHFLCGELGYYSPEPGAQASTREQGWLESRLNVAALEARFGPMDAWPVRDEALLAAIADPLAPALANTATILDIDRIVLGGVVVDRLGAPLVDRIRDATNRLALHRLDISPVASEDPGIVGAATLVIESRLDDLVAME